MRDISYFFEMNDVEYKENYLISLISPVKIGGQARFIAYPNSHQKLLLTVDFLRTNEIKYKIVGKMSNILPCDHNYDGVIVKTDRINDCNFNKSFVEVGCGISLPYLAKISCQAGLSGLEELSGIPGSIGGAIRGNAGAFGREIGELIYSVTIYDPIQKQVVRLGAHDIKFKYRESSLIGTENIIISAILRLNSCNSEESLNRMKYCQLKRKETQPVGLPSLGSVFKKVSKDTPAARLIDECGLKGKRIGGAEISSKHAGFIINSGKATSKDFLDLVDLTYNTVYDRFNIKLEREIEIL